MGKYLKQGFVRELEWQLSREEISYSKMVNLIEEECIKNYKAEEQMSKLNQPKIPIVTGLDELLSYAKIQGTIESEFNWKLVRERDGLTKQSKGIKWIEWNENDAFKDSHELPAIGLSLLMSPFNQYFTWQTTVITEIVEQKEDYIKFKTGNSKYELFKIDKQ